MSSSSSLMHLLAFEQIAVRETPEKSILHHKPQAKELFVAHLFWQGNNEPALQRLAGHAMMYARQSATQTRSEQPDGFLKGYKLFIARSP